MKLFEWFASRAAASSNAARERNTLSRRDFFARMSGRGGGQPLLRTIRAPAAALPPLPFTPSPDALHTFFVPDFPEARSQKVLPLLRVGLTFHLRREKNHPDYPHAVRIDWGRSFVGYVPPDISPEIAPLIEAGTPPVCRVSAFDPDGETSRILQVELSPFVPYSEEEEEEAAEEEAP